MAIVGKHNMAKMTSSTTGTGTLTLDSAVTGYLSFEDAGVVDDERVKFAIRDGAAFETGVGIYSGGDLSRDTVLSSSNSGSKINLTGHETVSIVVAAEDHLLFGSYNYSDVDTVINGVDPQTLSLDTTVIDMYGLASISSNHLVIAEKGWYMLNTTVYVESQSTDFDGALKVTHGDGFYTYRDYDASRNINQDFIFLGSTLVHATTDAFALQACTIGNHLNVDINCWIEQHTIRKVGDTV